MEEDVQKISPEGEIPKAEFTGKITIGDMTFPCSVLSDGTRILTQSDFMTGMGMYYSGWIAKNRPVDQSADMPHFLAFKSISPFIAKHLGDLQSIVVKYKTQKGTIAHGIKAEIIPKICEIWLDAADSVKLGARQQKIAQRAKILMRALAYVGIIALIDEATGYQDVRMKRALENILNKYLLIEAKKYAVTFPLELYKEWFKLNDWEWKIENAQKRPGVIGKWTNKYIYARMAPKLLEELQKRNPKAETGYRKHKHFQFLTDEVGEPKLREFFGGHLALARATTTWRKYVSLVERAYPSIGDQVPLDLEED